MPLRPPPPRPTAGGFLPAPPAGPRLLRVPADYLLSDEHTCWTGPRRTRMTRAFCPMLPPLPPERRRGASRTSRHRFAFHRPFFRERFAFHRPFFRERFVR